MRQVAVGNVVVLRGRMLLQHSEQAMVIRKEQAGGGDECSGASREADRGGQQTRTSLRIPETQQGQFQALTLQGSRVQL